MLLLLGGLEASHGAAGAERQVLCKPQPSQAARQCPAALHGPWANLGPLLVLVSGRPYVAGYSLTNADGMEVDGDGSPVSRRLQQVGPSLTAAGAA